MIKAETTDDLTHQCCIRAGHFLTVWNNDAVYLPIARSRL